MAKVTIQPITVQEYDFQPSDKSVTVWYTENGQPKSTTASALDFHYYLYFAGVGIAHTGSISDYFNNAPTRQLVVVDLAGYLEHQRTTIIKTVERIVPKRVTAPLWLAREDQMLYMRGLI